ncbi:class I SAM-dependent methyltransferase [Streptomyces thermolilacinus]|uniref:class I SAM-dependent methyltransferase n=1 Tax=Streptomyces thermolilacinus TaxID=285540 RepID=UPI0033E29079
MTGAWRGGDYTAAGDAWAHAADDVTAHALRLLTTEHDLTAPGGEATAPVPRPLVPGGEATALVSRPLVLGDDATAPGVADQAPGPLAPAGATATPRVLDVGTGSGPAALAAARSGARVTGLDLEPGLLRTAGERARRAGLADRTRFVVGDARRLPFRYGAFDAVLSTFGVMFAPGAARVAAELVRVCRPGGVVAVASWTPDGVFGRVAPTATRHLDRAPDPEPPTRWGEPAHVRGWFGPLPVTLRTEVVHVRVTYPSVEHAVAAFADKPGPLRAHRAAREALGRWDAARAALAELFAAHDRAGDGTLAMDVPYLLATARVRARHPRAAGCGGSRRSP